MNKMNELAAKLADLDTYTQRSVIGSWAFFINSQCITQGLRALPNMPEEGEGIDGYTPWEGAMRTLHTKLKEEQKEGGDMTSTLPAFVALQRYVSHMMSETGGDSSTIEDTHTFLTQRAPTRERFEADFAMRVKMGMRPGIPRKDFVDAEYARAMDQHTLMISKGQHAVEFLDRLILDTTIGDVERGFDDLPEWVSETLEQKLVQKLRDRWTRLEMTRTNPRVNVKNRDAAEGDQLLIVETLKSMGEIIGQVDLEEEPQEDGGE